MKYPPKSKTQKAFDEALIKGDFLALQEIQKQIDCCNKHLPCQCRCHTTPDMKHCMPCCYPCPNCGENVIDVPKPQGFREGYIEE